MLSLGRRRLKIWKVSEDVTEGGILFPSSKRFYFEENIKMGEENRPFIIEFTLKRLGAQKKVPWHMKAAREESVAFKSAWHMKQSAGRMAHLAICAGRMVPCRKSRFLWVFLPWKTRYFGRKSMETFPINTAFLIHNFSFITRVVQEEFLRAKEEFYLLISFLGVYSYLFVSCL